MENFRDLIEFCNTNMDKMRFSNKDHKYLLDCSINYLLNNKFNKWNKEDAFFIINYTNKYFFEHYNVKNFKINVLEQKEMEKRFGKGNFANCAHMYYENKLDFQLNYGIKVQNLLTSNDYSLFAFALHTIFHELAHAYQQILIHSNDSFSTYTFKQYALTLEDITLRNFRNSKSNKEYNTFYRKHYLNFYHEKHADEKAIDYMINFLHKWNNSILEYQDLKDYISNIQNGTLTNNIEKDLKYGNTSNSLLLLIYEKKELEALMPKNTVLLEQYPILNIEFDKNGIKKDTKVLIKEKMEKINFQYSDLEQINNLYNCIQKIEDMKNSLKRENPTY